MMKRMRRAIGAATVLAATLGAGTASAQTNVLLNPGFENTCPPTSSWGVAGNVSSADFFYTSGSRSIKMFGPFCCPLGYSVMWQDVPALAGQSWEASANCTNPYWDPMSWNSGTGSGSRAFAQLDFVDSGGVVLTGPQQYISSKVEAPNGDFPIALSVGAAIAPVGTASARLTMVIEQGNYVGGAVWWDDASLHQTGGNNTLLNPSFEAQAPDCFGSPFVGWHNFGNGQGNFGENARTGNYAAKLFGGYYASVAYSGWFQDVSTTEGTRWKATGWARSSSTDSLQPVNDVYMTIEYYDASFNRLADPGTRSDGVPTPGDNTYRFYETGNTVAPVGTAHVRCVVLQVQFDYAGGATWWDDVELLHLCHADYNGDGFVDGIDYDNFNNDFENPDPQEQMRADYNGDGFVDGIDYDQFNNDFETPC